MRKRLLVGVGRIIIEMRCADLRYLAPRGQFFRSDVVPFFTAIASQPDEAVVGASPKRVHALERRRESVDDTALLVGAFGGESCSTLAGIPGFPRVRSVPMACQEFPPSVVLKSTLLAK